MDTVKSAGYRENTPDCLSKVEMECDYFYLRAHDGQFALKDWHGKRVMLKKLLGMRPLTRKIRADFGLYDV